MAASIDPPESGISPDFPFHLHTADVLGSKMTYVDTQPEESARGKPVALFIHGNPTSSYLWRNVIPHVSPLMRCVALDLIGMGGSSKPANLQYRFTDHYTYLSTFIETVLPSSKVLVVVYDWGSGLGLHWARQQAELATPESPSRVMGLALMEFVQPFRDWQDFGEERAQGMFKRFRSPEGRNLIIENNFFIEKTLPGGIVRKLTDAEMEHYRRPFLRPADREPTYRWPNQIPIDQFPADVWDIATRYHDWLVQTDTPKILFYATPGSFVTPAKAQWYAQNLKNTKVVHVGAGRHFLPEDQPTKIGVGIHDWVLEVLSAEVSRGGRSRDSAL